MMMNKLHQWHHTKIFRNECFLFTYLKFRRRYLRFRCWNRFLGRIHHSRTWINGLRSRFIVKGIIIIQCWIVSICCDSTLNYWILKTKNDILFYISQASLVFSFRFQIISWICTFKRNIKMSSTDFSLRIRNWWITWYDITKWLTPKGFSSSIPDILKF